MEIETSGFHSVSQKFWRWLLIVGNGLDEDGRKVMMMIKIVDITALCEYKKKKNNKCRPSNKWNLNWHIQNQILFTLIYREIECRDNIPYIHSVRITTTRATTVKQQQLLEQIAIIIITPYSSSVSLISRI